MSGKKIRRFAEGTEVSPEKSKTEIERLLRKHGATKFISGWDEKGASIAFELNNRQLKYVIERPTAKEVYKYSSRLSDEVRIENEWKRRWRSLLLILKAKLEIVHGGDSTFDREFMADIMLPDGSTISDQVIPQLEESYASGKGLSLKLLGSGS